jgi:hypothetical protein
VIYVDSSIALAHLLVEDQRAMGIDLLERG